MANFKKAAKEIKRKCGGKIIKEFPGQCEIEINKGPFEGGTAFMTRLSDRNSIILSSTSEGPGIEIYVDKKSNRPDEMMISGDGYRDITPQEMIDRIKFAWDAGKIAKKYGLM